GELLALAAQLRQEAPPEPMKRLAVLGVESLEQRLIRTLSRDEARAALFTEAATSSRVRVIYAEEPFINLDPRASTRLRDVLRQRAIEGCAIVISTSSVREAGELADDHLLVHGGRVVGHAASFDALAEFTLRGTRMRVVVDRPLAF